MKTVFGIAAALVVGAGIGAAAYAYAPEMIRTRSSEPPLNFVAASQRVHTAGQPSAAQLGGMKEKGYGLVINLAPPTTIDAITEEAALVAGRGITYLNIPVEWHNPRYDDFALFSQVLRQSGATPVLVHCQLNKRASMFTFLYRVVHEGARPDDAWSKVNAVWVPDEEWTAFARMVLKRHNVEFDPF
jgi:protein tyrosine phosphatase (PTP) superfamily phosphohydrolase (DUF442 family)